MKKFTYVLLPIIFVFIFVLVLPACSQSSQEGPADNETGNAAQGNEQTAWPRTYKDALEREVVIEQEPQRPALIFFRNFDQMFTLDVPPYAATDIEDVYKGWASLAPFAAQYEIVNLGDMQAPNLEKLLECEPDLIIVYSGIYEKIGGELDKIATTIAVSNYGDDWQTPLREYGSMFGKESLAESEIGRISTLLSSDAQKYSSLSESTVACIALQSAKEFLVYNVQYIYDEEAGLGLTPPKGFVEKSRETISLEGLAEFNPDYLLVYDDMTNSGDEDLIAELSNSAVWNSLTAVREGKVFMIDRSAFSGGPVAIEYGTDAIRKALLG
jgi:iron complex transport system substrate-binding protein